MKWAYDQQKSGTTPKDDPDKGDGEMMQKITHNGEEFEPSLYDTCQVLAALINADPVVLEHMIHCYGGKNIPHTIGQLSDDYIYRLILTYQDFVGGLPVARAKR